MPDYLLEMKDISKAFPGVQALKGVNINLEEGEVHALLGENGAGKSTLIKILGGIYPSDTGDIYINGEKADIKNPNDAKEKGISIIHQEICLAGNMTISENIFLGREPISNNLTKSVNFKLMNEKTQEILDRLGLNLSPQMVVEELSIAQQQMVEIAKAISFNSKIIVMDEPTASLTDAEVEKLFAAIDRLKSNGVAIIYISHRLEELFEIADNVTILRDGEYIDTVAIKDTTKDDLVRLMVGRELGDFYTTKKDFSQGEILEVKNLTNENIKNINFSLKKGEILGFYGLVGSGRTEVAKALFGIDNIAEGQILLENKRARISSPQDAIKQGIALVPENRKEQGLILIQSIAHNISLTVLEQFIKPFKVDFEKEREIVDYYGNRLSIKMSSLNQKVVNLSGGNQQKVVISKWLAAKPRILILDEPTRGIDVGAKSEIYQLINALAEKGIAIIMISSDLPEILNMSSRIAVMHEGRITKIMDNLNKENTQEEVMFYATGGC